MVEAITSSSISLSFITLISLLVNGVTIYRWVSESISNKKVNNQAFHMIMGLANGSTRRGNMIVRRMDVLTEQGKSNEEAMIYLENLYADTKSMVESLLATAKALSPERADKLPYDGDSLLAQSLVESYEVQLRKQELEKKLGKPTETQR